jgi:23S rRNA (pseudouridine1915-N3)-methyltransferase
MLRITILQVGKTKDPSLLALLDEYHRRMRTSFTLEAETVKDEVSLWKKCKPGAYTIALEAHGKALDSSAFASLLHDLPVRGISHIQILIGPPEGFTVYARKPDLLLSLSAMTFSHQTIRLLLYEQLYRAATILEGKPFAK